MSNNPYRETRQVSTLCTALTCICADNIPIVTTGMVKNSVRKQQCNTDAKRRKACHAKLVDTPYNGTFLEFTPPILGNRLASLSRLIAIICADVESDRQRLLHTLFLLQELSLVSSTMDGMRSERVSS